jgi:hypothetical protein
MRVRLSLLLAGGPAASMAGMSQGGRKTIIGTSLMVMLPTGLYYPDKLINLGTHRWSFKPELALSQPIGKRWLFDIYAGLWLFTTNNSFYPGNAERRQNPMGAFQTHLSYSITPRFWTALDFTWYTGGSAVINGTDSNDRQENSRIGATLVFPVGRLNSIKIACSKGAIIRYGADFTSFSIGWQLLLFNKPKTAVPKGNA